MLVQPQGWKELREDAVWIRLRCPECFASMTGSVRHDVLARYDEELVRGHNAVLALYEALVYHNMSELADRFARALELDLIGADDFGRGVCGRQRASPVAKLPSLRPVESRK